MGERVVRSTRGLKWYTQGSAVGVRFAVREAGVDGRARAMYLKTDLTQIVTKRQILTTPGWTPPRLYASYVRRVGSCGRRMPHADPDAMADARSCARCAWSWRLWLR